MTTAPVRDHSRPIGTPLGDPEERFYQRYSPHGELPLSGGSSFAIHLLVIVLLALSAWLASLAIFGKTPHALPVEPVRLEPGGSGIKGGLDDGLGGLGHRGETEWVEGVPNVPLPARPPLKRAGLL